MNTYIIIHGTGGSVYGNWFGWANKYINENIKDAIAISVQLPTPYKQNFDNWESVLLGYLKAGVIDKNTTFICHSASPIFVVKFLLKHNVSIKKAIFVSGANNFISGFEEIDKLNSTLFLDDVSKFKDLCQERICFYSDNDPYIKLDALKDFADSIQAKHIFIPNKGHFNLETGIDTLPEIIPYL